MFQEGITCKQQIRICSMPKLIQYLENDLGWKGRNQAVRCFNFLEYWSKTIMIVFHIKFLMYLLFFCCCIFAIYLKRWNFSYLTKQNSKSSFPPPTQSINFKDRNKTFYIMFQTKLRLYNINKTIIYFF